uniref:Uncharacterized protein n=1 Tax=Anolis carolinensis TaxID=28377 RepID=A0A803T5J4_ANOCA
QDRCLPEQNLLLQCNPHSSFWPGGRFQHSPTQGCSEKERVQEITARVEEVGKCTWRGRMLLVCVCVNPAQMVTARNV